jgi:hypothetical protein
MLRTVFFPCCAPNDGFGPGRRTWYFSQRFTGQQNTRAEPCCEGLTRTRHDTRGLRVGRVYYYRDRQERWAQQGQAGKVGTTGTGRKGRNGRASGRFDVVGATRKRVRILKTGRKGLPL